MERFQYMLVPLDILPDNNIEYCILKDLEHKGNVLAELEKGCTAYHKPADTLMINL